LQTGNFAPVLPIGEIKETPKAVAEASEPEGPGRGELETLHFL